MASAFSLRESIVRLKDSGVEVIIFVNVMGPGAILKQSDLIENYPSSILWHEISRSLARQQGLATELIQVKTRNYKVIDFTKRNRIVKAGEQAGRAAAKRIARKYGF